MDLLNIDENCHRNKLLYSEFPERARYEPCMLGVDEAGRGPVLGPMVYGGAYCPMSCIKELEKLGVTDSKALTEEKREELFELINKSSEFVGWIIEVHSPTTISNSMLRRCKYNLNAVSHDSAINLIKHTLNQGVNLQEVYVDTVGPSDKYEAKLSEIFPDVKITVAKKADATYPIVGAASICAKVVRDRALKSWKFREGDNFQSLEYGSGYPNDPVTKSFLSENIDPVFGFPSLVRFSWSTAEKILEEKAVSVIW
ncbi:ribonuclease H2 subunit A [Tachypleus tridentatus]|uniref:ribonuclease H2 subunit A n=1 Tax=Tachypleus tridentatus TaxID=6853 RepID=UPI003FD461E9